MPAPTLLVLAPGLSHAAAATLRLRAPYPPLLLGSLSARPALSDEAARAVVLSGLGQPVQGARDLLEIAAAHGAVSAATLPAAIAAVRRGAVLVQLQLARGAKLDCLELAAALPESNFFVVGYGTANEASALLAGGPDIEPTQTVHAELVDIHPTLLSHLQILPPPGPMPDGRALHEIFRRFHLGKDEQEEVIAHLRAVGYIE